MKTKLNIAEILRDKPQGTKLYSSACGKCELKEVNNKSFKISFYNSKFGFMNGGEGYFDKKGKLYDDGECVVFPSKEMRDWSKFAWKKGDILVSNDSTTKVIFNGWMDDTYTLFRGAYAVITHNDGKIEFGSDSLIFVTCNYKGIEVEDDAQFYINYIERKLGGKLNLETLEIEKQYEFKNGDIAFADYGNRQDIFIVSGITGLSEGYSSFISIDLSSLTLSMACRMSFFKRDLCELRLATEKEKQQLFDALAKEGKAWDAEKKEVIDLKPKWTPKPFDRVITRDDDDAIWTANIFSHIDQYGEYVTIGCVNGYSYCLPYNEETAKLLGTTKDVEG